MTKSVTLKNVQMTIVIQLKRCIVSKFNLKFTKIQKQVFVLKFLFFVYMYIKYKVVEKLYLMTNNNIKLLAIWFRDSSVKLICLR